MVPSPENSSPRSQEGEDIQPASPAARLQRSGRSRRQEQPTQPSDVNQPSPSPLNTTPHLSSPQEVQQTTPAEPLQHLHYHPQLQATDPEVRSPGSGGNEVQSGSQHLRQTPSPPASLRPSPPTYRSCPTPPIASVSGYQEPERLNLDPRTSGDTSSVSSYASQSSSFLLPSDRIGVTEGDTGHGNAPHQYLQEMAQPVGSSSPRISPSLERSTGHPSSTTSSIYILSPAARIDTSPVQRSPTFFPRRSSMPDQTSSSSPGVQTTTITAMSAPGSPRKSSFSTQSSSGRGKRRREDDLIGQSWQSYASSQRGEPSARASFSGSASGRSRQSSLSGGTRAEYSQEKLPPIDLYNRRYELIVVQQSTSGCAFGSNLLSRLPCSPPLIIRLRVKDAEGRELASQAEEPFLVCQACLVTEDGRPADLIAPLIAPESSRSATSRSRRSDTQSAEVDQSATSSDLRRSSRRSRSSSSSTPMPPPPPAATTVPSSGVRMLYGSLAASPQRFRRPDEDGGGVAPYFIFPELCIRSKGRYRIRVKLVRLPKAPSMPSPLIPPINEPSETLTSIDTDVVEVFLTRDYVAPYVTDLTRFFARQGAALPLPAGDATE